MPAIVAFALIKLDCAGVGFSYGQRNFAHALAQKRRSRDVQEHATQTSAPITRPNAELGDVPAKSAYARAQDQPDNVTRFSFQHDVRNIRREDAASRVAHNVMQEPKRAVRRAVLVVDYAIWMLRVGF